MGPSTFKSDVGSILSRTSSLTSITKVFNRTEVQSKEISLEEDVSRPKTAKDHLSKAGRTLKKFGKFIGPGFMVAVAYIDPGNYATDVAAGAETQFKLLFMVLLSNVIVSALYSYQKKDANEE